MDDPLKLLQNVIRWLEKNSASGEPSATHGSSFDDWKLPATTDLAAALGGRGAR